MKIILLSIVFLAFASPIYSLDWVTESSSGNCSSQRPINIDKDNPQGSQIYQGYPSLPFSGSIDHIYRPSYPPIPSIEDKSGAGGGWDSDHNYNGNVRN